MGLILPPWPWLVALGVAVGAVGVQTVRVAHLQASASAVAAERSTERATAAGAAASAIEQVRSEERTIANTITEALNDERSKSEQLAADVLAGAAHVDGLRQRADALAAACDRPRPASPAAAASGPPAAAPGQLLADLLVRMEQDGRELAAYADRARIAGETCERSYDALTVPQRGGAANTP